MIHYACLSCKAKLGSPETKAGKRAKCPKCKNINIIPQPPTPPAQKAVPPSTDAPPPSKPSPAPREAQTPPAPSAKASASADGPPTRFNPWSRDRILALASGGWVLLVLLTPLRELSLGVWLTGVVLLANAALAFATLVREKRVLVLPGLVLLALFGLLHFQVYSAFGAGHYRCDRDPGLLDWIGFALAHALRAADVLDFLEEYGIDLQNVHHASPLSGVLLVALHLVVGVLLLSVAVRWLVRLGRGLFRRQMRSAVDGPDDVFRQKEAAEHLAARLKQGQLAALLLCLGICVLAAVTQGWSKRDWFLWPLDNALRTVDVADSMQIFDWKLHSVAAGFWAATLAVAFRLLAGLYIAEWLNAASLKWLGHRALRTVEEFADNLGDDDPEVRKAAAEALGRIGPAAAPFVPRLAEALADGNRPVRHAASEALGRIGPAAKAALPHLVGQLADGDWRVRSLAADALAAIDPDWAADPATAAAVPRLLGRLADGDDQVRVAALGALGKIGPSAAPAVPRLTEELAVRDDKERYAEALGRIGPPAAPAIPRLIDLLSDGDERVRQAGAEALARIGSAAVPRLIEQLARREEPVIEESPVTQGAAAGDADDPEELLEFLVTNEDPALPRAGAAAAQALGRIGPAAAPAVPRLVEQLAHWDDEVSIAATEALGKIGPSAGAAIRELVERLADWNEERRQTAEEALRAIDGGWATTPAAADAVPGLIGRVEHGGGPAGPAAVEVLRAIDPGWAATPAATEAIARLIQRLTEGSGWPRPSETAAALGRFGSAAAPAVPCLIEHLSDEDPWARSAAAGALGEIGPAAVSAVPRLIGLLADEDIWVRSAAAEALGKFGPPAAAAVPRLIELLAHGGDPAPERSQADAAQPEDLSFDLLSPAEIRNHLRASAAEALGQIGPAAKAAVPRLTEALSDADEELREAAARALGRIGPAAKAALPALKRAVRDWTGANRDAAEAALQAITPAGGGCIRDAAGKGMKGENLAGVESCP